MRNRWDKRPVGAVEAYYNQLSKDDLAEIEHYARWLHKDKGALTFNHIRDAWIEAIINIFIKRGLLAPLKGKK